MQASAQFQALAISILVPNGQDVGWDPELVWMQWWLETRSAVSQSTELGYANSTTFLAKVKVFT